MEIMNLIPNVMMRSDTQNVLATQGNIVNSVEQDTFESKLQAAMSGESEAELKEACVQFEELMLSTLYKQMKATVQRSDITDEDPGRETYEQWYDDLMVKEMAKNGSFGLANMMYKQLSKRLQNAFEVVE